MAEPTEAADPTGSTAAAAVTAPAPAVLASAVLTRTT